MTDNDFTPEECAAMDAALMADLVWPFLGYPACDNCGMSRESVEDTAQVLNVSDPVCCEMPEPF